MLSYKESLEILKESKALLEGHFILSSGLHSSQYIQCAQLLSKPHLSRKICSSLADKIKNEFKKIDLILSPAIGGIVIGYEMGKLLNKEAIFAERIDNNFTLRRDFTIPKSSKVLIVEDVITTGKSSLECVEIIKKSEAEIVGFACLIDRSQGKSVIKSKIVSQIEINIPTYNKNNLPETLLSIKAVKPGSRGI
jgi:orotate phosphoribosyltransferase